MLALVSRYYTIVQSMLYYYPLNDCFLSKKKKKNKQVNQMEEEMGKKRVVEGKEAIVRMLWDKK